MGLTKERASWVSQEYGKLLMEDGQPLTFGEFLERVAKASAALNAGYGHLGLVEAPAPARKASCCSVDQTRPQSRTSSL